MAKTKLDDMEAARCALVRLAFTVECGVQWIDADVPIRVQSDPSNQGLTANAIEQLAREWIVAGNKIKERIEDREGWEDRREFWYFVVIPMKPTEGFGKGLFVEMELTDDDEECPLVSLCNAHPSW